MKFCTLFDLFVFTCLTDLVLFSESHEEVKNAAEEGPVVWIKDGGLRGFTIQTFLGKEVLAFQGIPFAQPPVGELRFREPVKNVPWNNLRDAIAVSPKCIQTEFFRMYEIVGQEDCLYINVYTPKIPANKSLSLLPVLVGIHQGGFIFGSNVQVGPTYLMDHDVVLVAMNYRLGALGFLSTGDEAAYGNNGLKDQVLALQWIQENIHNFAGDRNSVTLFGESAGAGSTHFHMMSPMARGLFHRGISQSGCAFCFWSIDENPSRLTNALAKAFKCPTENSHKLVECLRAVDVTALVQSQLLLLEWATYPVALVSAVIEPPHLGAYLTELPEKIYKKPDGIAKVPWIVGVNSDELAVNLAGIMLNPGFVKDFNDKWTTLVGPVMMELKNSTEEPQATLEAIWKYYMGSDKMSFETRMKAVQMLTDRYLNTCGHKAIRYHANYTGMPVYAYYLDYIGKYSSIQLLGQNPKDWGPTHMDDLIYLVNNTEYYSTLKPEDEEYKLSKIMTSMWTNFAIHGKPLITEGGKQIDLWEPVLANTSHQPKFLHLNAKPAMIPDPFEKRIKFWDSLKLREGDFDS